MSWWEACQLIYGRYAIAVAALIGVLAIIAFAALVLAVSGCSHRPVVKPETTYVQEPD